MKKAVFTLSLVLLGIVVFFYSCKKESIITENIIPDGYQSILRIEKIELEKIIKIDDKGVLQKLKLDEFSIDFQNNNVFMKTIKGDSLYFEIYVDDSYNINKVYKLRIKDKNNRGFKERMLCYATAAAITLSDGPSPVMDIIAFVFLGECLEEASQY